MSPDKAARWLIMSSYLYYQRNTNVLDDGEYDDLSNYVADSFDELSEQLQWQLESAEAIRATGNGIKITKMGESAAIAWHEEMKGELPEGSYPIPHKQWKKDKRFKCHYSIIGG